jgi:hypothetical protein
MVGKQHHLAKANGGETTSLSKSEWWGNNIIKQEASCMHQAIRCMHKSRNRNLK